MTGLGRTRKKVKPNLIVRLVASAAGETELPWT